MKKKLFGILFILILLFSACDRFKHVFEQIITAPTAKFSADVTQGYAPMSVNFTNESVQGTNTIIAYNWDFEDDGVIDSNDENPTFTFTEIGDFITRLTVTDGELESDTTLVITVLSADEPLAGFTVDPVEGYVPLEVVFTDTSVAGSHPITNWEWDFENDGTIDSYEQNPTFTYTEPGEHTVKMTVFDETGLSSSSETNILSRAQNVLIELFTGNWCVNCPVAEAALHHLKSIYGNRLSYVEYHLYDELQIPESIELQNYYSASSLPSTIIQGTDLIMGTPEGLENLIISYIDPILEQATEVELLELEIEMTRDQLDCSVQINIEPGTDITDYYLKYVLIEDESTEYFNHAHENLRNIAIAADKLSLETQALEQPVEFSLELMNLPYPLPDDIILVVWVQKIVEPYNESTCQVYNVIEKSVE